MLDRLIGNNEIKTIARRMIANGRVPRSLLFAGPEGSGKREFALEIARASVCVSKVGDEGCGRCPACIRASKYAFPEPDAKKDRFERVFLSEHTDVGTVIPCRNNILVESVRELEREANFMPYEAPARFFIIDEADKMNDAASNALLKTLEEPPATSHIFLITARPDTLLPTIRSRCQTLRFAPVATSEVAGLLMRDRRMPEADAELVARVAGGSVGRALAFDLERFREQRAAMLAIVESAIGDSPDPVSLLGASERLSDAKFKDEFYDRLDVLQMLIRDVWTVRLGRGAESAVNADLAPRLAVLAEKPGGRRIPEWIESIEALRERRVLNLNRKISCDALLIGMCDS